MKRVYFLRRIDGIGPIKIGCSDWPAARAKQIGIDLKARFVILAEAPGGNTAERNVHLKFASLRVTPEDLPQRNYSCGCPTEWFEPSPKLLSFIAKVQRTGKLPLSPSDCREKVMARRYRAGETLQQIGDRFGITRERVRQILRAHGVPSLGYRPKPPSPWLIAWRERVEKERLGLAA